MIARQQIHDDDYLIHLRLEALNALLAFSAIVTYLWLIWMTWPSPGNTVPAAAWLGCVLLIAGLTASYLLRDYQYKVSSRCLIWSGLIAVIFLQTAFENSSLVYLFILPIVFTTVLLQRTDLAVIAGTAIVFCVLFNLLSAMSPLLPVIILLLVTVSATLAARHLNLALHWALESFETAHHNAEVARQRQAELKHVLKTLDTASYSLARSNYLLALARSQAEEGHRLKQQFAQNISHELRTPLNLIVGFTEMMIQSPEYYGRALPPRYIRDLGVVHRNATHLQNLVNDVLDLARIETAQMTLMPERVDLGYLVRNTAETARSLVETRGLRLNIDIEPELPAVWVDITRVRQVLFNLINNATRFTESGSITVSANCAEHEIVVSIADTGIGIPEPELDRIFDPFHQIDSDLRRRQGGAGLGLAISRQFIMLHHGRIWAESRLGQGSTFTFALPIKAPLLDDTQLQAAGQPRAWSSPDKRERTILIVTPSSVAGSMLSRYLHDCRVVVTQNFDHAREIARKIGPQIILIDDNYDQLHAAITTENIVGDWDVAHSTVMICPLPGEERLRRKLAADGYLIKPINRQNLWDMLRQFGEHVDQLLIIDDDRDFVQLMIRMLDQPLRRYQITEAHDGYTGLTMLDVVRPDLIFLDLELPDLHGSEVLHRIRERPDGQNIPVVVISATDDLDSTVNVQGQIRLIHAGGWRSGDLIHLVQAMLEVTTQ